MPTNEQRLKKIFKLCYELVDKYKDGIKDEDWQDIALYVEKLDRNDPFAGAMYVACYEELIRQYKANRQESA